jgi:RNA:NAD 2'-phosphotransferase (TPT1/KptA family)
VARRHGAFWKERSADDAIAGGEHAGEEKYGASPFYGQSITEQGWWKIVSEDLKTRFPNANLIIENRAIGGHSSQLLVKTAEADLYPFQPDLVISTSTARTISMRKSCAESVSELARRSATERSRHEAENLTEETTRPNSRRGRGTGTRS